MIRIAVDKAQKEGKHDQKHEWMISHGCELEFLPLPVGDYVLIGEEMAETIRRRGKKLKKMDLLGDISLSVDTKASVSEIYQNLVGPQHARFRDECILAQKNHIKLIVLIESGPEVLTYTDLERWHDVKREMIFRASVRKKYNLIGTTAAELDAAIADLNTHGAGIRPPVSGGHLAKAMRTMEQKYGVEFRFCCKEETGLIILQLLTEKSL